MAMVSHGIVRKVALVRTERATTAEPVTRLRERLATLADLRLAGSMLAWDQQTGMPSRGAARRAEVLGTLEEISHGILISTELGEMIDAAAEASEGAPGDSDDARLIAVARRHHVKARRVPTELATEIARADSLGQEAWVHARAQNDFAAILPFLERNFQLAREYAGLFAEEYATPYDALLDDYDEGLTSATVTRLFAELAGELRPILGELRDRPVDTSILQTRVPVEAQRRLVDEVLSLMGFERAGWRLDDAIHPFASGFGSGDIRITTRWDEGYFPMGLYGAMHECGHGLYEQGVAERLQRTLLEHGASLSLHESQSRMWENMVGRGRAFADVLAPLLSRHFGLDSNPDSLFRAVNAVRPTLIRVDADEVTYGLHVVLRFELEQATISGELAVADLAEAWRTRFRELFDLEVPDDAHGVLQDVHWGSGIIGYFPTYSIGNLTSGHLWRKAREEVGDLEESLSQGRLGVLREWLRENVHRHGCKFDAATLLERVTGEALSVEPFIAYLREKLSLAYGVDL